VTTSEARKTAAATLDLSGVKAALWLAATAGFPCH
jgi:hypothetical protein